MKKCFLLASVAFSVLFLANCSSSKKVAEKPKLNFEANVQSALTQYCAPCHIPAKGGNKRPYDNYANAKADIDEIIRRISLKPGERGFMPMRSQTRLSDSVIAVFTQWKADGLLEK